MMLVRGMELRIALRALAFLLVVHEIHGYSGEWYGNPLRRYISQGIFNRAPERYTSRESEDVISFQTRSGSTSEEETARRLLPDPEDQSEGEAESAMQRDGKIFFPDFTLSSRKSIGTAPVCEGTTFCENTPEYPEDLVNKAIITDSSLQNYANVDAVDSIAQRIDISDVEPLCISTERVVYPKSAESMSKQWLYIVNQMNFTQGVRIETCVDEDSSCKIIDGFAQGYITACKQKYIYRQLSAVAPDGSIIRDFFRFPASCCCHVQFTGAGARMASMDLSKPRARMLNR